MAQFEPASYLTDDRDRPVEEQRRLVIFLGGNGDWYVQVAPAHGKTTEGVRLSTHGGASHHCPGLTAAIADAYRAMKNAEAGISERVPDRQDLQEELNAWRAAFPDFEYDFFNIRKKF